MTALTQFVRAGPLPLIVAGDFNMSPWTEKLPRFTRATGLGRYNTFHLTWPMRARECPLVPLVAIDNVFASHEFASDGDDSAGPRLGSDHRAVIADIALAAPVAIGGNRCPALSVDPSRGDLTRLPSSLKASR